MINFQRTLSFKLFPINLYEVINEVHTMILPDEKMLYAFRSFRDQLVFTDKRIIAVDIKGVSGKKRQMATLPYSRIQYFSVSTPGIMKAASTVDLFLSFSNGFTATFYFVGKAPVQEISYAISKYVL